MFFLSLSYFWRRGVPSADHVDLGSAALAEDFSSSIVGLAIAALVLRTSVGAVAAAQRVLQNGQTSAALSTQPRKVRALQLAILCKENIKSKIKNKK